MKRNNRMKEWRQTIAVICAVVVAFAALAAFMQSEHAALRADMNAQHAALRADMDAQHAALRVQLNSVDRRTARIEGHLFGIEVPPDPADGE